MVFLRLLIRALKVGTIVSANLYSCTDAFVIVHMVALYSIKHPYLTRSANAEYHMNDKAINPNSVPTFIPLIIYWMPIHLSQPASDSKIGAYRCIYKV